MQIAERDIWFYVDTTVAADYCVVDTFSLLSQINRRSYRQGYELAFEFLEAYQSAPEQNLSMTIHRLPNTWVTVNAWTKAYHHWKEQQDEAMDESDTWSMRAKYRDFKVCYNAGHASGDYSGGTGNVQTAVPADTIGLAAAQAIDSGASMDWDYSMFVIPNLSGATGTTEDYIAHMLGGDMPQSRGVILAYAESRARPHPEDPSIVMAPTAVLPDGGLYAEMADVGDDMQDIVDLTFHQNVSPPYIVGGTDSVDEFYLGGDNNGTTQGIEVDTLTVRATNTTLTSDRTGPFTALCGLLWIENNSDTENHIVCRLRVAAGNYKGVLARSMAEAN